jgi:tetratricopeptide (TPR) repeat protein
MTRLAFVFVLLGASVVAAQPAPQTAEEHYEQSKRYYAVDEFDKAIAELKIAYTMAPDPVYLFNIAQAMRKKGDCAGAIDYYRKYLRDSPKAANRTKVEGFIKELEPCAAKQPKEPETKPVEPPPVEPKPIDPTPKTTGMVVPPPTPPVEPRPAPQRSRLRLVGVVTAGVGGAFAIGGTVLAFNARGIQNGVETRCNSTAGCDWTVERGNDQRGRDRALQSKILLGVGAAAMVTGAVLYVVGKPVREAPVAIVPVESGGMVVAAGRF